MPSQEMQDAINALRDRQQASAGQAPPEAAEATERIGKFLRARVPGVRAA
jgi:hypothetical protein